jgi:hypothetical protein
VGLAQAHKTINHGGAKAMQNYLRIISISLMLIVGGCTTINNVPPGYDLDLTPDNNGETWR